MRNDAAAPRSRRKRAAPPALQDVLYAQHLRNAANYRPFQSMSPLEIMDFLEARGFRQEQVDEAMRRIVARRSPPAARRG